QVVRGAHAEIAELDRIRCVHELGRAALDPRRQRTFERATAVPGGEDLADLVGLGDRYRRGVRSPRSDSDKSPEFRVSGDEVLELRGLGLAVDVGSLDDAVQVHVRVRLRRVLRHYALPFVGDRPLPRLPDDRVLALALRL